MNLLSRLLVLVAVALLPAIAIQAYNEFELRAARQVELQDQALSLARLAAAEQQQIVQGIRQVLVAFSELPAIKTGDSNACNAYLAVMKQRFPAFLTFLVVDLNGRSFCDTNTGHHVVDVSARAYFTKTLETRAFTVGEFSIGLSIPRNVLQFSLPFYDEDGRLDGVIIAALSLDWLARYIALKGVSPGDALVIMDRNGTCLARYPDNIRFVGRKMAADEHLELDEGTATEIIDRDGVARIVGFAPLGPDSGGLLVSYGLDKAHAFKAIQHGTQRDIFLIVLSTSLVLLLTSLGARRFIHRPLGLLVDAANQWRRGEFARRVDMEEKSEIGRVADAFNVMADALEHREHELNAAKEKAEQAAARITRIFESTTDSVLIIDRDWRISYLNERARMQVSEGRDIIGMEFSDAFPDTADTEAIRQLREAMSSGRPASFEVFWSRHAAWYSLNAFPSDQGLAVYFRDITEHKHAVEARRLTEEQLHQSQKMEAVGQLTGGVAHDFNNMLAVISGNLELIEDMAANSRVRRFTATARRAADRGAKLTAQLLSFSRQQKLNPELIDANTLLSEFEGLIRQAVGGKCEVRLRTHEHLWPCLVDPALLETALLNLVLNARDAMPDGGILEIETQNVALDERTATGPASGPYVRLSVKDSGCGMPPEVRDRIFEPFFTTKATGKGTGLGLSMVYGFARQSGGHVTVQSEPGAGTAVMLYLPAATPKPGAQAKAVHPQDAPPAGSERILLVEDNEDILELTSGMLTKLGYIVRSAPNGTAAIQMLESGQKFDLLFSDIVMPGGMSGVELAQEAMRLSKGIKILLTSGYAGDVLERHREVEQFPFIRKPFRRTDLAQRLQSILHGSEDA